MLYKDIHKLPPSFKFLSQNSKLIVELDVSRHFKLRDFHGNPELQETANWVTALNRAGTLS